ncbi:MAG: hypothetical protein CL843_16120 [Crocinitomicaceae bacterium]|nr:hypothetical protein [Crocinitomicaceae bacterium]
MDYISYVKRLSYLKELIEKGKVKSPNQVADKFNCSEKTIRNMINRLRDEGFDIRYSKAMSRYYIHE